MYRSLLLTVFVAVAGAQQSAPPLLSHVGGSPYFTDPSGKAVYLTGSHHWSNLQDGPWMPTPTFPYAEYLDLLIAHNHNLIRMWAWESGYGAPWDNEWRINPTPFGRSNVCCANDGGNKYDLTTFNQAYFDRLRSRVIQAGQRGIYVSVMLFNGWSTWSRNLSGDPYRGHPFNPQNNVNGVTGNNILIHTLSSDVVNQFQKAYVRKVVDTLHDLSNLLYEIANEADVDQVMNDPGGPSSSKAWQYDMISYIKNYEQQNYGIRHPVGMTKGPVDPDWEINRPLWDSPADWIGPGDSAWIGSTTYDYRNNPPVPQNNSKVVIVDSDHVFGVGGDAVWVWKTFLRGNNVIYMDPWRDQETHGASQETLESARVAMGQTAQYSRRINLNSAQPHSELASTGYALVTTGQAENLVLQPGSGAFQVSLPNATFNVEWLNIASNQTMQGAAVGGGGSITLTPPFSGPAVAYLKMRTDPPPPEQVKYVSDLPATSATNGWGPIEKDMSNGETAAGDGRPMRLNGITYTKGLGVHAPSDVRFNLGGRCSQFSATIGLDEEVAIAPFLGSIQFQVFSDGTLAYSSPTMRYNSTAINLSLPLAGVQELRLVVTDAGDGIAMDHGDWADARVTCAPAEQIAYLSELTPTFVTNGWGPIEKDTSNGETAAGDGRTTQLNGTTYTKGLGVHAPSDVRFNLAGRCSQFSATIGLDEEVAIAPFLGSIQFQVFTDGTLAYVSPTMRYNSTAIQLSLPLAGVQELRLVVTDAGDGIGMDHGDWADARVSCIPAEQTAYLSDLTPTFVTNGWGPIEKDTSNGETAAGDGRTMQLNGSTYAKGLGVHAPSDVRFNLGGKCSQFSATIGLDEEMAIAPFLGSVQFQVFSDGTLAYSSPTMRYNSTAINLSLPLAGVQELRLVVTDAGDGIAMDHGDWADARVTCAP